MDALHLGYFAGYLQKNATAKMPNPALVGYVTGYMTKNAGIGQEIMDWVKTNGSKAVNYIDKHPYGREIAGGLGGLGAGALTAGLSGMSAGKAIPTMLGTTALGALGGRVSREDVMKALKGGDYEALYKNPANTTKALGAAKAKQEATNAADIQRAVDDEQQQAISNTGAADEDAMGEQQIAAQTAQNTQYDEQQAAETQRAAIAKKEADAATAAEQQRIREQLAKIPATKTVAEPKGPQQSLARRAIINPVNKNVVEPVKQAGKDVADAYMQTGRDIVEQGEGAARMAKDVGRAVGDEAKAGYEAAKGWVDEKFPDEKSVVKPPPVEVPAAPVNAGRAEATPEQLEAQRKRLQNRLK